MQLLGAYSSLLTLTVSKFYVDFFVEYNSFKNITHNNEIVSKLEKLYQNINNVDLWVGGLAEEHQKGELGPTFRK